MSLLHDKISPLIESQFPAFYREEGPTFVEFVKTYYEWLEATNNPLYHSRHLLDYADIDTTLEEFLPHYQLKYLPETPTTNVINQRDLVKHNADIYRTRGTIQSLKLVFRMLYNEEVDVYYPGDDILKASDGKWVAPKYLEVSLADRTQTFVGQDIVGVVSGARGFVERVDRRTYRGQTIDIVYLSNVVVNESTGQSFISGEMITNNGTHDGCPTVYGSLGSISVTSAGSGFEVGQIVDVLSANRGNIGKARVTSVGQQTGEVNYRMVDGGFGYTDNIAIFGSNEKITVSSNVITITSFTSSDASIAKFDDGSTLVQPQTNVAYTGNAVAFAVGDLIVGANSTANTTSGIFATGICLSANASGHILISPRTTVRVTLNTISNASSTGSYSLGEVVYQPISGANAAVGKVLLANSTVTVFDQRYGPFQAGQKVFGVTSKCSANATTVSVRAYTDANFANANVTRIFRGDTPSANAAVSSATRMTITATIVGANTTAVGIINPTVGGSATFNANTGVNSNTNVIATTGVAYHKFANGDRVTYLTAAGNTALTGLSNNTVYFVVNTSNNTHLQLSSTFGGSAIDITATSVSEIGHTLTSVATKSFQGGTNAWLYAGTNTSITAEATAVSGGYPGSFQIGTITDSETAFVGTTQLNISNTAGYPITNTVLNATSYGFPALATANLSSVVGSVLSGQSYTIGSILSLTNRNPGFNNTAKPFIQEIEQAVANYGKPSRNYLSLDTTTVNGTFRLDENVEQTVSLPAMNLVYTSTNCTFSSATRELVRQVRSDGVTVYGEVYSVDTTNKRIRVLVANTSNTFNTSNTVVSVANSLSNVAMTSGSSNILNVDVKARGRVISIDTVPGTLTASQVLIKQRSFQNFQTGGNVVGISSGANATISSVSGDYTYGVLGADAIVDPQSDISDGTIKTVQVSDSGFFYQDGETVTLAANNNEITAAGVARVDTLGFAQGYWRGDDGELNSTKRIQDNEYYQEHSYVIRSGVDRNIYESAVKSLTHVAGTKMFSSFDLRKVGESIVDAAAVSGSQFVKIYLDTNSWHFPAVTYDNPSSYSTRASDFFGSQGTSSSITPLVYQSPAMMATSSRLIVGASQEDGAGTVNTGVAYIYNHTSANALLVLTNPNVANTSANDFFGHAVAASDSYLVVGAPGEDSTGVGNAGRIYTYHANGTFKDTIVPPDNTSNTSHFGSRLAISPSGIILAGVPGYNFSTGTAYTFVASSGLRRSTFTNPNPNISSRFGDSVAISDTYAAVSATLSNTDSGGNRVYVYNTSDGALRYTLSPPTIFDNAFGMSLAISGNRLLVGARNSKEPVGGRAYGVIGRVYLYDLDSGSLVRAFDNPTPQQYSVSTDSDLFGISVAIDSSYIAIGAIYEDDHLQVNSGVVHVYDATTFEYITRIERPTVPYVENFSFGLGVSVANNSIFVVAPYTTVSGNTNSGSVYRYSMAAYDWTTVQQRNVVSNNIIATGTISTYDPVLNSAVITPTSGTFNLTGILYQDTKLIGGVSSISIEII